MLMIISFIIFGITLPIYAHKVILYAYVEGDNVIVEGSFDDGTVTNNALVKVYGPQDELLQEGSTDEYGIYEFNIPQKTDLKIVLNAGMGHQAEYKIDKEELPEINNNTNNNTKQKIEKSELTGINEEKLRAIISDELDKKITPINKKLVKIENSGVPGVTEILGGIGYIFGIMGIALYFVKGRNKS